MSAAGLLSALEKAESGEYTVLPVRRFLMEDTVANYLAIYNEMINGD